MKAIAVGVAAAFMLAGLSAPGLAATKKKPRYYAKENGYYYQNGRRSPGIHFGGYREMDPEKLPVGSSDWWRAMDYYGRGGQSGGGDFGN